MSRDRYMTPEYAELADIEWEAITRPCSHEGCGAQVNEQCTNPLTGKPYSRPIVHAERRQPSPNETSRR